MLIFRANVDKYNDESGISASNQALKRRICVSSWMNSVNMHSSFEEFLILV